MKSVEYIKGFINDIVERFPNIKCSYGFDILDHTHTIEISPSAFRDFDDDFKKFEDNFYDYFFESFPNEIAYIIDENSDFPVTKPIYVKSGLKHIDVLSINDSKCPSYLLIEEGYINFLNNNSLLFNPNDIKHEIYDTLNLISYSITTNVGENNYALAA